MMIHAGTPLVLSVFPGIDLLGRGFEGEGFCVVRGPDLFWGGDVRNFHPPAGVFGGIIGGPPCQAFSGMMRVWKNRRCRMQTEGDLIPEFARIVLEARPNWWLMENVPAAPLPDTPGYQQQVLTFNCRLFGVKQKRRIRKFVFGHAEGRQIAPQMAWPVPDRAACRHTAMASEGAHQARRWKHENGKTRVCYAPRTPWPDFCELQGLPRDYDLPGMSVAGKYRLVGNAVPLPVARAFARAIREMLESTPC